MSILTNPRGFGVLEIFAVAAVLSFLLLAFGSRSFQIRKQQVQDANYLRLDVIRRNIIAITLDDASWDNTLTQNPPSGGKMDCLLNSNSCNWNNFPRTKNFALYDATGTLIFDATDPKNGLKMNGDFCNNFDATDSPDCPFRFELTWSSKCNNPGCVDSIVNVKAALIVTKSLSPQPNPDNYMVPDLFRSSK